ncbi:hypothetical protein JYU23_00365 [bacterium AH-315-C07]|nr:hypothetical protein [bacterium AH-315-C07]
MKVKRFFVKLRNKWGIRSTWDIILILIVFALAGSSVLHVSGFVSSFLGFDESTSLGVKVVVRILIIFPVYQILLLMYSFILGQFNFFWEKEKKMGKWIINLFSTK